MWISGHLPTQKSIFTLVVLIFFFFPDLNYAGVSLKACKENASLYQFSEIANFSDRIVLEGLKEIQAIYYQDRRIANIDSNILRIWFETSGLNTVCYREYDSTEKILYYLKDTIITIQFMVTVPVSSTLQWSVSKLMLPGDD